MMADQNVAGAGLPHASTGTIAEAPERVALTLDEVEVFVRQADQVLALLEVLSERSPLGLGNVFYALQDAAEGVATRLREGLNAAALRSPLGAQGGAP